jgi:hypothetical protein
MLSAALLGDLNSDGRVDDKDFGTFALNYGHPGTAAMGDLDGSGFIDDRDFGIFAGNFGKNDYTEPAQFAAAVNSATTGDVIWLDPQSIYSASMFTNLPGKAITIDGNGDVIDGGGKTNLLLSGSSGPLTIENLTFTNARNMLQAADAMAKIQSNWTVIGCSFTYATGAGCAVLGSNVTMTDCDFDHNGQLGVTVQPSSNVTLKDCNARYNNTGIINAPWSTEIISGAGKVAISKNGLWYVNPEFEAGGSKMWGTTGLVVDGGDWSHNVGPGIWFDETSHKALVENTTANYNAGLDSTTFYSGVGYKIEWTSTVGGDNGGEYTIRNCTAIGNAGFALNLTDCWSAKANGILIDHNDLEGGIQLRLTGRQPLGNITITNNIITAGAHGLITGWDVGNPTMTTAYLQSKSVLFDYNEITWGAVTIGKSSYSSLSALQSAWKTFDSHAAGVGVGATV